MNDLKEAFVDAVEHLDLPDVDVTAAVLDRISTGDVDPLGSHPDDGAPAATSPDASARIGRPALVGAALVLALGLILAVTPAGRAVADWFGIGATVFEVDDSDADEKGSGGADDASTADLGRRIQPAPDIVPIESLGQPDAVFDDPRRGRTYVWDDGGGQALRLSVRSTDTSSWAVKSLAAEDDVELFTLEVPNEPFAPRSLMAAWVGAPHTLTYPVEGLDLELRVDAGPVLIWVEDSVELRFEGAVGKDEAVGYAIETLEGTELLPPG